MLTQWEIIQQFAIEQLSSKSLDKRYEDRLLFELNEIKKQGAEDYWVDLIHQQKKFENNPHGLVFPFLIGITDKDPIEENIEHIIEYQPDFPDIDIDFLPIARDPIKTYAAEKYGEEYVCSIGSWQTYKPKSALQDAARVYGEDFHEVIKITKEFPDDFDDMDMDKAISSFPTFREYAEKHPQIVGMAYKMVGLIKTQGRHAGGLLISSVPIRDHIPLTFSNGHWISAWTEGRRTQLSKLGFIKFDILGLSNLMYIWSCCNHIKENLGITIDFDDMDPEDNRLGWMTYDGIKKKIRFDDEKAIELANQVKTDSIFQFDTPLAKKIIADGGVKSFDDLVVYSALGRPGPLPMVSTYIKRRDGYEEWEEEEDPEIVKILKETHGVICFESNTLIRTANGKDIKISELKEGDLVYSYNIDKEKIEVKPVLKVGKTREGKGLKITTDDNRSIIVTEDHKFICHGNQIKQAKELEIDDLVPVPITGDNIRYQRIKSIEEVNGKEYFGLSVADNHTVIANGIIVKQCYQEQLASIWRKIASFTAPEAEAARKAVAKKWIDKLEPIKHKWINGASKRLGQAQAETWWEKMETFGRYAFNRCLDKDTLLIDTATGIAGTVEQWYETGSLLSLPSMVDGSVTTDDVVAIYDNGEMEVYEVEFDDGSYEHVTLNHRFLCEDGEYHELQEIVDRGLEVVSSKID